MSTYTFVPTELETACGVTTDDVARELPRGVFRDNDSIFVVSADLPPALAGAVARTALGGPVEYVGKHLFGHVYRRVEA